MISNFSGKKVFSTGTAHATLARAQQANVAGKRVLVTDVAGSSDKTGAVLSVKQGTPAGVEEVLFTVGMAKTSGTPSAFSHSFETPIIGDANTRVWVEVDGTASCRANIAGIIV